MAYGLTVWHASWCCPSFKVLIRWFPSSHGSSTVTNGSNTINLQTTDLRNLTKPLKIANAKWPKWPKWPFRLLCASNFRQEAIWVIRWDPAQLETDVSPSLLAEGLLRKFPFHRKWWSQDVTMFKLYTKHLGPWHTMTYHDYIRHVFRCQDALALGRLVSRGAKPQLLRAR